MRLAGSEAVSGLAEVLPKVDLGHLLEDEAVQVASSPPDSPVSKEKILFFWFFKNVLFKGTVRPDWICMRVVPLDSPLKGLQPLNVFDFLISMLNI